MGEVMKGMSDVDTCPQSPRMQMTMTSIRCVVVACVALLDVCLNNVLGDDTKTCDRRLAPAFVGDQEKLPSEVFRQLQALSQGRLPHVEMHQALVDGVVSLVETWLGSVTPGGGRIEKPLTIEAMTRELRIDFESRNESILKTVCQLTSKIGIDFAIRADGTYVLQPPRKKGEGVFRIHYVGIKGEHEVFRIERVK